MERREYFGCGKYGLSPRWQRLDLGYFRLRLAERRGVIRLHSRQWGNSAVQAETSKRVEAKVRKLKQILGPREG